MIGLLQGSANWTCVALLSRLPNGLNDLAIYHIVNQWYSLVLFVPNVASSVLLPFLSGGRNNYSITPLLKAYAIASSLAALLLCFAAPLVILLYGEILAGGLSLLIITFVTGAVVATKSPLEQYLLSKTKVWGLFYINLFFVIVFVVLTKALLDAGGGVLEVIVARLVSYILFFILCVQLFNRYSKNEK